MKLNIPGSENIITSDQFLEYAEENLPDKIVFIGGGYISFEFAHVAARAGAKVTILHRGRQPLEHFDPDLVNLLMQRSQEVGIDFYLQSKVEKIDKLSDDLFKVQFSDASANSSSSQRSNIIDANLVVRMYFGMSISSPYLQATAIAAASKKEIPNFEILVNISRMTVSQMSLTEMTESPQQQQHWLGGQVLNWSGVPIAHVRSTIFWNLSSLAWRPHQSPKMGQLECHLARRELHQFPLVMWQESFPQF